MGSITRSLFLLLFTSYSLMVCSQKIPYFLTTFYFVDAIGNKDSIEIGFDLTANHGNNPEFGEMTDMSPFDSLFDVRAVNYFEYYNTTPPINPLNLIVKRIVGGAEQIVNGPCIGSDYLIFFIHAIHQPVTISVKSIIDFQKIDCPGHNTWNFLSPDRTYHFIEPWGWASTPGVRFGCLKDSTYTLYLGRSYKPFLEKPYILKYEIDGVGVDSIYGICFIRDQTFYQCDSTYVSTDDKYRIKDFLLYPNPLSNYINVQIQDLNQPISTEIINQTGVLVGKLMWNDQTQQRIDVHDLPSGIYFLRLNYKGGNRIKKFIKL